MQLRIVQLRLKGMLARKRFLGK